MNYSTLPQPPARVQETTASVETVRTSMYEALQGIPDPRRGEGKRYSLSVLICLLCLAKMAGQTTLKGATEWVRLRASLLASSFGLKRLDMPCQMTYTRILEVIDAQALNDVLAAFFTRWEAQSRCQNEPSRLQTEAGHLEHAHVAIDGKAIRATSKEAQPVHQLSAYDVKTGVVLFQVNVQEKQNEISALKPLLTPAFIKGRIFTLDAMHTQTEMCAKVDRFGGAYLLVAKDNQPTLVQDLTAFFADPPWDWSWAQAETWDKAHGRFEHRRIICSPDLNDWFASRWAGVAQVFRLERNTTFLKSGAHRQQIIYGISNLSVANAPALCMLQLNRDHWGMVLQVGEHLEPTVGRKCEPAFVVSPLNSQASLFTVHIRQAQPAEIRNPHACVHLLRLGKTRGRSVVLPVADQRGV